ncbi:UVR domain-containing protein [Haematococcus lacustris]|uniref:UVR domain-containing protein n=1 Tax=Haematococcus lacustris TaxID=44745 RepID=A0A699Y6L4_HAELA|nr:UVR domain-containing protein [Haematococcus lacustris]
MLLTCCSQLLSQSAQQGQEHLLTRNQAPADADKRLTPLFHRNRTYRPNPARSNQLLCGTEHAAALCLAYPNCFSRHDRAMAHLIGRVQLQEVKEQACSEQAEACAPPVPRPHALPSARNDACEPHADRRMAPSPRTKLVARFVAARERGSSEDDSSSIRDLRAQLEAALAREEYKDAARLRDAIQLKTMDAKLAVEEANGYERDLGLRRSHPSYPSLGINHCWAGGGVRPRAFNITLEDVRIYADEAHAFVTCVEVINADDSQGRITATNIFEKQDGKWKITLHHGSEAPLRKKPSPFAT